MFLLKLLLLPVVAHASFALDVTGSHTCPGGDFSCADDQPCCAFAVSFFHEEPIPINAAKMNIFIYSSYKFRILHLTLSTSLCLSFFLRLFYTYIRFASSLASLIAQPKEEGCWCVFLFCLQLLYKTISPLSLIISPFLLHY
jgi:hypothetical protein